VVFKDLNNINESKLFFYFTFDKKGVGETGVKWAAG
jgi:hypothetical protein